MPENYISKVKLPGNETIYDIRAHKTAGIYYAQVDSTSTSTNFTATIADLNIDAYYDGLTVLLYNGKVTSASGFTININGLGAKPSYSNMALGNPTTPTDPTRDTTIFNINYAMLFTYNSTRVSGGCWICYRGYDANTNTIGYQLRTNSYQLNTADAFRYYKILFTSADNTKWVPAASATDNSATSKKTVNQRPINPFGEIVYCGSTTNYAANAAVSATTIWQQYTVTLGYSFNRTGAALTLTTKHPVYVKCAPQSNGSAIIDADQPYVQTLPNEEDGKIYILLGMAYSATAIELLMNHPIYYYKDGAIRVWTNPAPVEEGFSGSYTDLTNKPADGSATIATVASDVVTLKAGVVQNNLTISNSNDDDITLAKVAKTGSYNDLGNKPTIPTVGSLNTNNSSAQSVPIVNESFGGTINLHRISKTGAFSDLIGKPSTTVHLYKGNLNKETLTVITYTNLAEYTNTAIDINVGDTILGANGYYGRVVSWDTATHSGNVLYVDELELDVDVSSLTGVVPLSKGGTGVSDSNASKNWYNSYVLHPHFEVVQFNGGFLPIYVGPTNGITSVETALEHPAVKKALSTLAVIVDSLTADAEIIGTAMIMSGPLIGYPTNTWCFLFSDAISFNGVPVNGVYGEFTWDVGDFGLVIDANTLGITQPYFWTHAGNVVTEGMGDSAIGSSHTGIYWDGSSWQTTDSIPTSPADIGAAPLSHTHTSNQVTKYATDATIATNDKLAIFDSSDSNKLKGSSITFDTTETGTYLRRDGTWAAPPSGGNRVVYTAYCDGGEVGDYQGTITLDDSKTGADIIADIESGNQVVIQVEDTESNTYEFTYSGARDNNTYIFTYTTHNNTNFQIALIITTATVVLRQGVYMELISNRVGSITSSSLATTYPNTKAVYNAISGGAYSHYKLSTMDIAVSANYQTITIDDIVGGFDCAVGDIVIGRNGNYGHIVTWSTSANPHSGTILYDGYLDDQIWSKSTSNGVYYPSVISSDDSNLANGSLTLFSGSASQAIGAKTGQASLNLQAYTGFNLSASHAAGSTSYTLNNATLGSGTDVSYLSNIYFYTAQHYTALKPTSVTASGTAATLVFSESLNPTSAVSQLYILNYDAGAFSILAGSGAYNAGYANVNVGTFISNTGHYSVVGGNKNSNGGQGNIIGGNRNKVTGHYDVVGGQSNLVTVSRALIGGLGHDTTNGPANVVAVGAYSSISSDTAFAVGIGTADNARANAFVVHTDGRATVAAAPTADMDVATKKYVDDNAGGTVPTNVVLRNSELLTTNPFAPPSLQGPYISKIDNAFYAADKRFTVTSTPTSAVANLFNGNYENNVQVTEGTSMTFNMSFDTTSNGYFPGYPYGYIIMSFYNTSAPASITGRVYCDYETQGIGWHDLTFTPCSDNQTARIAYRARQGYYNITQIEITVTAPAAAKATITQIEMHLDRPDSSRNPFLSKYTAETLYYNLTAPTFIGNLRGEVNYGTCTTAAATAAKVVTCANFKLVTGARISVYFANGSTSTSTMTLNVNSTGAKEVRTIGNNGVSTGRAIRCEKTEVLEFIYNGTYWQIMTPCFLRNWGTYDGRITSLDSIGNIANGGLIYALATSSTTTGKPPTDAHVISLNWDNGSVYGAQLAVGHGSSTQGTPGRIWTRGQGGQTTWSDWLEVPRLSGTLTDGQLIVSDESTGNALLKGGPMAPYIIEVPTSVIVGSVPSGDSSIFSAAVTAMEAGRQVCIKIRSEQLDGTTGSSSNWIIQPVSSFHNSGSIETFTFSWADLFGGTKINSINFIRSGGVSTFWSLTVTDLAPASGVSF